MICSKVGKQGSSLFETLGGNRNLRLGNVRVVETGMVASFCFIDGFVSFLWQQNYKTEKDQNSYVSAHSLSKTAFSKI